MTDSKILFNIKVFISVFFNLKEFICEQGNQRLSNIPKIE